MTDGNKRDHVVERVRRTLPEFCKRNGIELDDKILDNLAWWVTGVIPSGHARTTCSGRLPTHDEPSFWCACTGQCQIWKEVYDEQTSTT